MSITRYLAAASVLALALPQAAAAQDEAATSADTAGLGDIIVTAQRREENLQNVAVAATALDGEALADRGVINTLGLETIAPAVSITDAGITQAVNIRGIGLAAGSPNVTAGVATYVDGLFQPPIVQSNSFFDLAGVEVFRGPQGTFVGSNSTGGAIFLNSQKPEFGAVEGYAQAEAGSYDLFAVEGAVTVPLGEDLAFRAAGLHRQRDSYYTDVGPFANEAGRLDETAGRFTLRWQPGAFEALARVQINDRQTGGYAYRPIAGTQFGTYRTGDIYTLSFDTPTARRERAVQASLELRQELGDGTVLRSLSGFQHKRINALNDDDASQAPFLIPDPNGPPTIVGGEVSSDYFAGEKQYSQEINVISPTDGDLSWVVGGYFQRNLITVRIFQDQAGFPTDIFPDNKRTTLGLFGQVNYQLDPDLELQVGTRWSSYEASGTGEVLIGRGIPGFPPDGLPVADLSGRHKDDMVTGKVALNWTVDDGHLLYAFASRGYKPGGFNSATSRFAPETVWNYEVGLKSELFDRHIRTQVDAFYYDYNDFQFEILEPSTGFSGVENVAGGTIKGLEAQVQGRFGGLMLDGSVAYVKSNIDGLTFVNTRLVPSGTTVPQCPAGVPADPLVCFDYTPAIVTTQGGRSLYSPKWTYNASVAYEIELGGDMYLTPRVNYSHVGDRFTYLAYDPVTDLIEGYDLVSASLTLAMDPVTVEAYGTNLTRERYVSGQFGLNEFYGAPREFGVRVSARY
ncbi:TonB-dependent receptor [Alteraurantiacibacter buctensis]|uniref:TonB-dependent receptor n=1 Tax=Alteraurantiacibacter buctensis TaxID=1503981 RepID=A0A844YZK1_9SPHN|nr:TonB-dependent receptor [Alteraurantiacibacter buctensis]MXO71894.1 TonB-dependent receptor [Alteraurantiacibacter buctensis]